MFARHAARAWLVLALFVSAWPCLAAEPLPAPEAPGYGEPLLPMTPLTSEAGFFARWRADHQERAARDGWIETDRPSFTLSSATVPRGWLQLESGWTYTYNEYGGPWYDRANYNTLGELNLRWGMTDRLELRARWQGVQFMNASYHDIYWGGIVRYSETQTANTSLGLKYQVSQNNGWIPQSAFVTELMLPTGDGYDEVAPLVDYIYTWQITERLSLGGSSGAFFSGFSDISVMQYFQSVILRYHYSPRLSLFYEWYGFMQKQFLHSGYYYGDYEFYPYYNTGLQFRPVANLQLDFKIGLPLPAQYQPDGIFTGCGLSLRY